MIQARGLHPPAAGSAAAIAGMPFGVAEALVVTVAAAMLVLVPLLLRRRPSEQRR